MKNKLTFIDMFAGIGGFRSGMEQAGHKCVGWIEWDKFARQSYQAMYNTEGEYNAKDIRTVKGTDLSKADVWCFGFPCQDVSAAGKQAGLLNGKRSGLFFEVIRLLQERIKHSQTLPAYLFVENVKNLLSIDGGWGFARMQIELDKAGYDTEWSVINSAEVVPQHRERIFIIGHLRGRSTRKVFPIIRKDKKIVRPDRAVKQIGNISNSESFGGNPQVGRVYGTDGISPTLSTMQGGGQEPKILDDQGRAKKKLKPLSIAPTLRSQSHGNESKVAIPVCSPDRIKKQQNGRRFKTNGEPEFTLTAQDRHGVLTNSYDEIKQVADSVKKYANAVRPNAKPIVRITSKQNIRGSRQDSKKSGLSELQFTNPVNKSNTVTASHTKKTWDEELRIRKLTPLECWRLQGFPDWAFERAKQAGLSDSQLYKQAGNSVTVPIIKAIAEKLKEAGLV